MSDTTRLGLPLIEAAQAQKHVTHNEALRILDTLVQAVAIDRDLAAPPADPPEGAVYIVGPSPSAGWAGHAGHLAVRSDGVWIFLAPQVGWSVWLIDENCPVWWNGTAWRPLLDAIGSFAGLTGVGIGTTPDTTNRLSVKAPGALFAAEPAADGGSGDIRLTVDKETAGDTASLLFQTGWSGRAEIGLAGDDDLHLKVSADGTTWIEALRITAATGQLMPGSGGLAGGGRLASMSSFSASGTWSRPAGIRWALIFAVGGGGGGGGAAGAASSGSAGGGGGGGGLAVSHLDVSALTDVAVTIGAAGAAGASTGSAGGAGGTTSFGADVVALGGGGGAGMAAGTAANTVTGGAAGTTSAGQLGFAGVPGAVALRVDAATVMAGTGGASFFGGGGRAAVTNANGSAGTARGSGGSGGAVSSSATGRSGGAGAAGFVWIWEFE